MRCNAAAKHWWGAVTGPQPPAFSVEEVGCRVRACSSNIDAPSLFLFETSMANRRSAWSKCLQIDSYSQKGSRNRSTAIGALVLGVRKFYKLVVKFVALSIFCSRLDRVHSGAVESFE